MSSQAKLSAAVVTALVVVVGGLLALSAAGAGTISTDTGAREGAAADPAANSRMDLLVRPDSHLLGPKGNSGVTFVEFLDFECEGCRAAYPVVEQLRAEYEGRVTFAARYFPMPGHFNAERAARAVEAASQQGEFEGMYHRMYETQEQWGEQQTPQDELFASFARDLGLNMNQFSADYADPATADRVAADVEDGLALGVQGTPTFFVDGKKLEPRSYSDLTEALDAALAR